jgi:ferredoxin
VASYGVEEVVPVPCLVCLGEHGGRFVHDDDGGVFVQYEGLHVVQRAVPDGQR